MTSSRIPLATLRTPTDMLEAVPFLLGFKPADAIVAIVVLDAQVYLTARWDLGVTESPGGLDQVLERLVYDCDGQPLWDARYFLVGYGPRERVRPVLEAVRAGLGVVLDSVIVDRRRWWFVDDPVARPGQPIPRKGRVARAFGETRPVLASRDALVAGIAPPTGEREDTMLAALLAAFEVIPEEEPAAAGRMVLDIMADWSRGPVPDIDYLAVAVAMSLPLAREAVWRVTTRDFAVRHLAFWKAVLTRTPLAVRLPPLAVLGLNAWIAGDGALKNICLEEAERIDPDFSLVQLLLAVTGQGVHPDLWAEIRDGLLTPAGVAS
ncbi:MAG: DUF4192 domain-containing protein [Propionibacteriaceae bacterium]|jgi:hypothetical protein|nr:DUF4192 domain-containing protein [Propionibacteriaceae bacterium]